MSENSHPVTGLQGGTIILRFRCWIRVLGVVLLQLIWFYPICCKEHVFAKKFTEWQHLEDIYEEEKNPENK